MDILYYLDAYTKEFEAEVKEVDEKYVVLDKTAFYATGGGQPNDTGKIISDKEYNVIYVTKINGIQIQTINRRIIRPIYFPSGSIPHA